MTTPLTDTELAEIQARHDELQTISNVEGYPVSRSHSDRATLLRELTRLRSAAGGQGLGVREGELERLENDCVGLEARARRLEETLQLILPLAKGYAHANPVGSNQEYVNEADALISALKKNGS